MPPELSDLQQIQSLDLAHNSFQGPLTGMANLSRLEDVSLAGNQLTGTKLEMHAAIWLYPCMRLTSSLTAPALTERKGCMQEHCAQQGRWSSVLCACLGLHRSKCRSRHGCTELPLL